MGSSTFSPEDYKAIKKFIVAIKSADLALTEKALFSHSYITE